MTLDPELDRAFAPWGYYVSDPGPDVTLDLCIDDPDGHARMLAQLMPDWPAPKRTGYGFRGPYFRYARHPWAMVLRPLPSCRETVALRCACGMLFEPKRIGGRWDCYCPECAGEAMSTEDGPGFKRGFGKDPFEAAQEWSEDEP